MTLHEAMRTMLEQAGDHEMTIDELAEANRDQALYRQDRGHGEFPPPKQFGQRAMNYPEFEVIVRLRGLVTTNSTKENTMLFDINGNRHEEMIHQQDYNRWMDQLSDEDFNAVIAELHRRMDETDIFKSSYLPSSDWNGTPYQPIYTAVGEDERLAALFYGLLVWRAVQLRDEGWYFIKQQSRDDQPTGMTYFRRPSDRD